MYSGMPHLYVPRNGQCEQPTAQCPDNKRALAKHIEVYKRSSVHADPVRWIHFAPLTATTKRYVARLPLLCEGTTLHDTPTSRSLTYLLGEAERPVRGAISGSPPLQLLRLLHR